MSGVPIDRAGQQMEWLNYHHLLYFWTVARVGSITRACDRLQLSQPTISAQLRALERSLGTDLFRREGRSLVMTEAGHLVFHFADEIFGLGREMVETLRTRPASRPLRLIVGIADVVSRHVALLLLRPAISDGVAVRLICREDRPEQLLAELAVHRLDLVLSDTPLGADIKIRAYNYLLGECSIVLLGTKAHVERYSQGFPRSLDGAPFLIPTENTAMRRALERWFEDEGIHPDIRGEFEDHALMEAFGKTQLGIFPAPAVAVDVIQREYGVLPVGNVDSLRERYYAITVQRKLRHPSIATICEAARRDLFKTVGLPEAGSDPDPSTEEDSGDSHPSLAV
jgi:LysR family transcriptional activator of nhaA